jgi:hypothetical protein
VGQTNPNTLQMMTKDMDLCIICHPLRIKHILGNQLMQKFWLVASIYNIKEIIVGNSGGTFKEWGYQRSNHWYSLYGSSLSRVQFKKW